MKAIALTLAFILELIAFAAFASLGFVVTNSRPLQIVLSVVLLVALVIFWSRYMAPRASHKVAPVTYYAVKFGIYAFATCALYELTTPTKTIIFAILAILDDAILYKHNLAERKQ